MKKYIIALFLVMAVIAINVNAMDVKIGLYFDEKAPAEIEIISQSGFEIGIDNGNANEISLFKLIDTEYNYLKIRKTNDNYVAVETFNFLEEAFQYKNENNIVAVINNEIKLMEKSDGSFSDRIIIENDNFSLLFEGEGYLYLKSPNNELNIAGKDYRGFCEIKTNMTVVNVVELEQYLYSVVPSEMPSSFNYEALKAQAVIARNYVITNLNKYASKGFNLCNTTLSQVYNGKFAEAQSTTDAVNDTGGKLLMYDGKPALTFFFSNSGGVPTETSNNIWSNEYIPYLTSVENPYDSPERSYSYNWEKSFTLEGLTETLKKEELGNIKSLEILERNSSGRVHKLKITGDLAEKIYEKERTRTILGLSSAYYDIDSGAGVSVLTKDGIVQRPINETLTVQSGSGIEYINPKNSDSITLKGRGLGHGVGLSQWGAEGMAEQGFNYDEILRYYFQGTYLGDL